MNIEFFKDINLLTIDGRDFTIIRNEEDGRLVLVPITEEMPPAELLEPED